MWGTLSKIQPFNMDGERGEERAFEDYVRDLRCKCARLAALGKRYMNKTS